MDDVGGRRLTLREQVAEIIESTVAECGSIAEAARQLGIPRSTIQRRRAARIRERLGRMPCPHGCGDPSTCSQCRGAIPKMITRDPTSGLILVDGAPMETRLFVLPPATPHNVKRGRPRKQTAERRRQNLVATGGDDED